MLISILSFIINENDSLELKKQIYGLLRISIKDSQPVYTQRDALRLLAMNTKGKDVINVIDILDNNLFPHNSTSQEKYIFLQFCP